MDYPTLVGLPIPSDSRFSSEYSTWLEHNARVSRKLLYSSQLAATNAASTGVTIAASCILDPNLLSTNGQALILTAYGTTAANANNKTVRLLLGTTVLATTGALGASAKPYMLQAKITRTGAATGIYSMLMSQANATLLALTQGASTEDFTTALTAKVDIASDTAASDVLHKNFEIELQDSFNATLGR